MIGILAFVAFVIGAVVFFLSATEIGDVEPAWGLFFVALGLALHAIRGVTVAGREL